MSFIESLVSESKEVVEIVWDDGHKSWFHSCWLRFNCQCVDCARSHVNQLVIDRSVLPDKLLVGKIGSQQGQFQVSMDNDIPKDHVTSISDKWLRQHCYCEDCLSAKLKKTSAMTYPDPASDQPKRFTFEEIRSDEGVFRWLDSLVQDGFNIVTNVPSVSMKVVEVAELAGPILEQVYGRVFDVFDDGAGINFSNSNKELHIHMDQPHYECAPGVQLLHFLKYLRINRIYHWKRKNLVFNYQQRFDKQVKGGESVVVDLFQCAEILRREAPEEFRILARVPTVWKTIDLKNDIQSYYQIRKTIIETDYDDQIIAIHWNPGTEEALQVHSDDVEPYYKAYRKFWNVMHRKEIQFEFRMAAGEVLVVNNRRMAHTRRAFDSKAGERFLQTTYISIDEMRRKYISVGIKLGKEVQFTKVGNRSAI